MRVTGGPALVRSVDCVRIRVPDIDAGLMFYRDQLGHEVIWRYGNAVGLRMPETDAEIVLHTGDEEFEVDLLVASADEAAQRVTDAGGSVVHGPFDIAVGRCVVVRDPWGTALVLLDTTRGLLQPDIHGEVTNRPGSPDGD